MNYDGQSHSRTNSSSAESTGMPVFTPQSSRRFSPTLPVSTTGSQSEDVPIPSIESPAPGMFELPDVTTPRILASSNTYDNVLDTLKQVNLSAPDNVSRIYRFGQEQGSSTFTFRNLHNTTPEPSTRPRPGQATGTNNVSRSGSDSGNIALGAGVGAAQSSVPSASANVASPPVTKLRASSAPVQPPVPNQSKPGKYNTNDETPPDEPYFNEDFQKALQKGKLVAQRIANILGTCELAQDRDSQVFSMIQSANELRQFDAPSVCTIGIVGDSGVGKSSLINSLLDETDLAHTAGLGAACTSVVTEYRLRKPGHRAKYTIEIDRMTDNEIEEQLRELLWSYRYFHVSDLDDKGMTADEQKRLEDQSKLAWDTLKAAFGSKSELTETYLRDTSAGAEERIQQQLTLWTNELQWPGDSHESGWLGSADTVDECKKKTQQFLTGNLWPFIKVIRLFLSSQVLKSGAILADLPGFHDSNNARVKAAEEYMYGCDEIFVVADITRVGTNKNVEMILQKSLGSNLTNGRPSQGIALVCTKSEDLDVDEIRKKFFADRGSADAARVKLLERTIEEAEADDGRAGALRQRDDAQDELDYLYMTARNDYIEKLVRSTHAKLFKNRPLSVFCVSNKTYKKNRRRVKVHDLPIKGSGVPALRSHCHKIPAHAQFRIAHHFLTVSLKALVQRVQLWLAGGSQATMPNDATVQRMLETLQNDLQETVSDSISTAGETQKGTSTDIMIQPMAVNLGNWTNEALEVSAMWGSYHHTQIAGFCRNYGSWESAKVEYREWNVDLIEPMVNAMALWWDEYAERSITNLDKLQNTILKLLDGLISQVKDFQGAPLFAEALVTKIDSIKYTFAEAEKNSATKMDSIKRDATQNHRSSYIFEEMRPAYLDCSIDRGSGVNARRLSRLRQAIGSTRNPTLFTAIRSRLRNALNNFAKELVDTLDHDVSDILKQIGSNIEMLRGSEAKILAKNGDFLDKLGVVIAAVMREMETIGEIAARVKGEAEKHGYS